MAAKRYWLAAALWSYSAILSSADSAPLARYVEFSPSGRLYDTLQAVAAGQCLPAKSSVNLDVPESAGILIVYWSGERPTCEQPSDVSTQAVHTVVLATKDPIEEVALWYRTTLAGSNYSEFEIPLGTDCECTGKLPREKREIVFAQIDVEKFCWNKHYPSTTPILMLKEAGDPWSTHGFATIIEYQQTAI